MNQSLRLTARLSPEDPFPPEYVKAFDDAETAIMRIISRRRTDPGDDIISHLVLAYDDGDRLSDIELFDLIFTFGAGAIESTAATMGGALLTLCQHPDQRSEAHTSELQSLMRISYAVFCLKNKHTHMY